MYGAPVDSDIPACVGADINSCDGFIEEDCSYEGGDLGLDPDDGHVADMLECSARPSAATWTSWAAPTSCTGSRPGPATWWMAA